MSARAAAVILTDTKSLSRFSVMKFSSVNVQSSPVVSRPPSLSSSLSLLRGTLAFIRRISLAARLRPLASFSHSHAHLYEHKRTATGYTPTPNTEPDRTSTGAADVPLCSMLTVYRVTSGLICSSLQQLSRGVDPMSTK